MKILLCISTLRSGGAEKNISILANLLLGKGYDITILTFDEKNKKPFFYLDKKIKVINLNLLKKSKNFFETLLNFYERVKIIKNIIKKGKFEYFISFINTMNLTLLISTFFLDIKKIISDRNNPYFSRNTIFIKILKIIFYNFSDRLIIQTKATKAYYWFLKNDKLGLPCLIIVSIVLIAIVKIVGLISSTCFQNFNGSKLILIISHPDN